MARNTNSEALNKTQIASARINNSHLSTHQMQINLKSGVMRAGKKFKLNSTKSLSKIPRQRNCRNQKLVIKTKNSNFKHQTKLLSPNGSPKFCLYNSKSSRFKITVSKLSKMITKRSNSLCMFKKCLPTNEVLFTMIVESLSNDTISFNHNTTTVKRIIITLNFNKN